MHKWAKQIMECVKAKVEAIGLDSFEGQNLDDLMRELQRQDKAYLEKIIENQNKILEKLADL